MQRGRCQCEHTRVIPCKLREAIKASKIASGGCPCSNHACMLICCAYYTPYFLDRIDMHKCFMNAFYGLYRSLDVFSDIVRLCQR